MRDISIKNASPQNADVSRALRKNEACDRLNRMRRGEPVEDDLMLSNPEYTLESRY